MPDFLATKKCPNSWTKTKILKTTMNVSMVVIKGTSFIKGETLGERRKKKEERREA